MAAIEQEILEKLAHLDDAQKKRVLEFVQSIGENRPKSYTARELLKLPEAERQRIIAESFRVAVDEDFEIFEAYSEEEIDDAY